MSEEWRPVPGHEAYEVSDRGRVRRVMPCGGATPGRILKAWQTLGYLYVGLWTANTQTRVAVHRLVATAFLPAPAAGCYQVAHRDGDRQNNVPANLYWATPTENAADRHSHGTDAVGENNPRAKLTEAEVVAIRGMRRLGSTQLQAAEAFGVCRQTVSDIERKRRWAHV